MLCVTVEVIMDLERDHTIAETFPLFLQNRSVWVCAYFFYMPFPEFNVVERIKSVSRVGRKGGTKVLMYGRKSPWVPTLTELFPKIQADAGSFVLLCPIKLGEQFLLSSFREFVHDGCLDHGLSGSWTKEMQAVRKLSV